MNHYNNSVKKYCIKRRELRDEVVDTIIQNYRNILSLIHDNSPENDLIIRGPPGPPGPPGQQGPPGSLRYLTDFLSSTSGNENIHGLQPSPEYLLNGNGSIGFLPSGSGSLLIGDGRTSDGNLLESSGQNTIDFMFQRDNTNNLARSDFSVILGGCNSTIGLNSLYSSIISSCLSRIDMVDNTLNQVNRYNSIISSLSSSIISNLLEFSSSIYNNEEMLNSIICSDQSNIESSIFSKISNSFSCSIRNAIHSMIQNSRNSTINQFFSGPNIIDRGVYNNIIGGYDNSIIGTTGGSRNYILGNNCQTSLTSTYLLGEGLYASASSQTFIGKFNDTTTVGPNLPPSRNVMWSGQRDTIVMPNGDLHDVAIANNFSPANVAETVFGVGYGEDNVERQNLFTVNRVGVTWTKRGYTASGADLAEEFKLSKEGDKPDVGDLVFLREDGLIEKFNPDIHNNERIIGVVSNIAMLVGTGDMLLQYERDPDTLDILDQSENNMMEEFGDIRVIVGMVGRVMIKKDQLKYIPDKWLTMPLSEESIKYDKFCYCLIR